MIMDKLYTGLFYSNVLNVISLSLSLSIACPSHRYGQNCAKTCFCYGKAHCDPVTGECICPAGLTGPGCWKGEHSKTGRARLFNLILLLVRVR